MDKYRSHTVMTLSELADALRGCPPDKLVVFDFGYIRPSCDGSSYRGDYSEFALGYDTETEATVAMLLDCVTKSIGSSFEGYKGGTYTMYGPTPVYVANYGEWTRTGVYGVRNDPCEVVIETRREPL